MDLGTNNGRAAFQCKYITDENVFISVDLNDICYLNDWIGLWSWEFSSLSRALYIKTQNTQRRYFTKLALAGETFNSVEIKYIDLNLAHTFFFILAPNIPVSFLNLNPSHSTDLTVNHEPECV